MAVMPAWAPSNCATPGPEAGAERPGQHPSQSPPTPPSPSSFLPSALVSKQSGMTEHHALEATRALLRPASVRSALHLGACEFRDLRAAAPWDDMKSLERLHVYVAPQDIWCPDGMCRRLGEVRARGAGRGGGASPHRRRRRGQGRDMRGDGSGTAHPPPHSPSLRCSRALPL